MLSKSCQYAIRSMIYLANHRQEDLRIGVKEMAHNLSVPQQFLAKVLQQLARHDMVGSLKGPTGGFWLEDRHLDNSILKIIECIDGPLVLNSCILGLPNCSSKNPCPLHNNFFACREELKATFKTTKIESFLSG